LKSVLFLHPCTYSTRDDSARVSIQPALYPYYFAFGDGRIDVPVVSRFQLECGGHQVPHGQCLFSVLFIARNYSHHSFCGAMLANRVFNKHEFLNVPVFVPAFVYAMSASALCLIQMSIPALLANIFILLGLQKHLTVHRQPRILTYAFESAFWYGMAAVVFPPYIVLLVGMLVAVLISRAFHWREMLIPVLSFGVPFLYWVVWMYVFDYHDSIILFQKTVSWDNIQYFSLLSWSEKMFVIATFLVFVAALPRYLILSERGTNKAKNVKHVFLIIALSTIASFIVGYLLLFKWVLLTAVVPLAFIGGYWFSNYRYSFLAPFVFYAFCLSAIVLTVTVYLR
jgi:hypothetical protein